MASDSPSKKLKRLSDSDRVAEYDVETQKALEEIDSLQNELDKINEEASQEILQLEQKYNHIRTPYLDKRTQIISNIPNFWVTAIMNHPDLRGLVGGSDEEDCLHHLTKLEVEEFDDIVSGHVIKFYFDENPYFENSVLTKEFHLGEEVPNSRSTAIVWKEGQQLGSNHQDVNRTGTRKRRLESMKHSFFSWFNDNVDPYTDDIADIIKDDLWLNPLQYYLVADGQEEENGIGDDESSSEDNDEAGDSNNRSSSTLDASFDVRPI
ncbi:protein SET-like [Cylas formicarius]|uniref:protein SET-like n=1 Tax=Cylas formicarius TaxID=197179 RepID=UPI0029586401|nr:protein SET-like [Cylas formicarius]